MTDKIEYFFYTSSLEWNLYRNQDMTLEQMSNEFEEAWYEAEALEDEYGDVLASEIDEDCVASSVLIEELTECEDSTLSDIRGELGDTCSHISEMIEEFGGKTKCGAFQFGQAIITDEQRAEMAKAS